jgi:hypothetical protein
MGGFIHPKHLTRMNVTIKIQALGIFHLLQIALDRASFLVDLLLQTITANGKTQATQ